MYGTKVTIQQAPSPAHALDPEQITVVKPEIASQVELQTASDSVLVLDRSLGQRTTLIDVLSAKVTFGYGQVHVAGFARDLTGGNEDDAPFVWTTVTVS